MIVDGWTSGDEIPPRFGSYWVNLEREPGAAALFFYSGVDGWAGRGGLGRGDQRERINLFGQVMWWRKAELPAVPPFTPSYYEGRTAS